MDKAYASLEEPKIYDLWEKSGAFTPKIDQTKIPFTIILPPPNANNPLHAGHIMYVVEDILVRYHRMLGDPTLWLPGTDHAGIESQFVFEKELKKTGKSRFDYDRHTLYKMISEFVQDNRGVAVAQMKRVGFSLDWTREKFTLDEDHNQRIFAVFRKMHADGLIYRDEKIVNYCTRCGTAFSNLEVNYVDEITKLYYMKYGPFTLATTRPETKFGDTAVAVNPKDKRYLEWVGKEVTIDGLIGPFTVKVIADDMVDPKFGTGIVKITPAHDPNDFDAGKRHHLAFKKVIDFNGRLNQLAGKYAGLTVNQAREKVVADLQEKGEMVKIDDHYQHRIGRCYRCNSVIEPMISPQWYIKMAPLVKKAIEVVKDDTIQIFPKRFKKNYLNWMKDIRDWPVSRQIVWGHQIPIWYNLDENPTTLITYIDSSKQNITGLYQDLIITTDFEQIKSGLQSLIAPVDAKYYLSPAEALKTGPHVLQETDTFDTWFSSGQWPYSTLGWDPSGHHSPDFEYFYPTTVLDTMWDILFFWVARMIIFGLYTTGQIPFKVAHMHSRVNDAAGQKMSKSKGNTINPMIVVEQYGADALRFALVYGVAPGSDIALSEDKLRSQRNFVNKIWNASRFIEMTLDTNPSASKSPLSKGDLEGFNEDDKAILAKLEKLISSTTKDLNRYHFGQASENLYQFFWHEFCDVYIEKAKVDPSHSLPVLIHVLHQSLKLLHPFMPYVTETIYQILKDKAGFTDQLLITSSWPTYVQKK